MIKLKSRQVGDKLNRILNDRALAINITNHLNKWRENVHRFLSNDETISLLEEIKLTSFPIVTKPKGYHVSFQ